ncbi:MAG: PAS domain S-box protein [Candidatus Omnitrophica bacterium]|nr:PAS domain S-box protein [Candidatus Omnitrophota bacterium]
MKLAQKIGLFFLMVSFFCMSIALWVVYWDAKETLTKSIVSNLQATVRNRTQHIETYLKMSQSAVVQASKSVVLPKALKMTPNDPGYQDALVSASKLLKSKIEGDSSAYEYMLLNASGLVVAASDDTSIGQDKSQDPYFLGAQKSAFFKDVYFSQTKKLPLMAISVPLFDGSGGPLLGVLVLRLKLDDLYGIVTDRRGLGRTGEVFIVNKFGYMITPSRFMKDSFLKQKTPREFSCRECHAGASQASSVVLERKDVQADVSLHKMAFTFPNYLGTNVLGGYEYVPQMEWGVLGEVSEQEVFQPLRKMRELFILVLLLVSGISWVLGRIVARLVVDPIQKLHKGTQIIGRGNLDYKVAMPIKDEVGDLSRAFDVMTSNLKKTTASIGILHKEIEERKKIESELEESERRFFDVLYASKDAILLIDGNRFVDANEAVARMLGYATRDEFLLTHPSKLSPPVQADGRPSFEKAEEMMRLAFEKGFNQFEWTHRKASGQDFPVQVSLTPVTLKERQILHCVWIDLSIRKQDEQRLREAQERLKEKAEQLEVTVQESRKSHEILASMLDDNNTMRQKFQVIAQKLDSILSSTGEGIIGLDMEGKHTFVNPQAEKLLGYGEDELVGKSSHPLWHHSHPDGSPYVDIDCPQHQTLQDGQSRHGEDYFWRKDGTGFFVEYSVHPVIADEGREGIVLSFRDVTERKRMADLQSTRMRLIEIASNHGIREFLQLSLDEIERSSESLVSFYHFVEGDQKNISLQAWSTRTKEKFCKAAGEGSHYSMDQAGVWADAVRERKPVIHNDYKSLAHRKGMP